MLLDVEIRPTALAELDEAAIFYQRKESGLGDKFFAEFDAFIELIRAQPLMYPIKAFDCRVGRLQKFPYSIYYRIEKNTIMIVSVLHQSRNPEQTF